MRDQCIRKVIGWLMKGRRLPAGAERDQSAAEARCEASEVLRPREWVLRLDEGSPCCSLPHKADRWVCVPGCREDILVGDVMGEAVFGCAGRCDLLGPFHEISHSFVGAGAKGNKEGCIPRRGPKGFPSEVCPNNGELSRFFCHVLRLLERLEDPTHGPQRASPLIGRSRVSRNPLQDNGHPPRCEAAGSRTNDDITKIKAGKVMNREREIRADVSKPWIPQNSIGACAVLLRGLEQTNNPPGRRRPVRVSGTDTGKNGHVPVVSAGMRDSIDARSVRMFALIRNGHGIHIGPKQDGRSRGFSLEDPCLSGSSELLEDLGDPESFGRVPEPVCRRRLVPGEFGVAVEFMTKIENPWVHAPVYP